MSLIFQLPFPKKCDASVFLVLSGFVTLSRGPVDDSLVMRLPIAGGSNRIKLKSLCSAR